LIQDKIFAITVLVVVVLKQDLLLGMDFLQKYKAVLDVGNGCLTLSDGQGDSLVLDWNSSDERSGLEVLQSFQVVQDQETNDTEVLADPDEKYWASVSDIQNKISELTHLNEDQSQELLNLFIKYRPLFSEKFHPSKLKPYKMEMLPHTPFVCIGYPIPNSKTKEFEKILKDWLEWGIIVEMESPYVNPIHCVMKANNTIRPVLDLRACNIFVQSPQVQTEPIHDMIRKLIGAKFISVFDLKSGYYNLKLTEDSYRYTAFMYKGGNTVSKF